MSQALYRKYRPKIWDEVVGQDHIVHTLKNAIAADRVAHAYLFAGSRGSGEKTLLSTVSQNIAQDHIVHSLKNAIAADRVAHAYLFAGSRGTGKTTLARLLAKAVNCLNPH